MSNTDLMNDAELVECAKAMRNAMYTGGCMALDTLPLYEQEMWIRGCAFARDFFRARWKPGPMPTPDLSKDTERVQLAQVLAEAEYREMVHNEVPATLWNETSRHEKRGKLAMAAAAITHLGSGYRLPEATEANAERLAKAQCEVNLGQDWHSMTDVNRRHMHAIARGWLRALHAAFAEPVETPEPVFAEPAPEQCTATNGDHRCELPTGHGGEHSAERLGWEEPSANDILDSEARINETRPESEVRLSALGFKYASLVMNDANGPADAVQILCSAAGKLSEEQLGAEARINAQPAKDPVREGERRKERQDLVLRFALEMAGRHNYDNEETMEDNWRAVLRVASTYADGYLAWRDADNEKAMEAYRCKK